MAVRRIEESGDMRASRSSSNCRFRRLPGLA